MVSVKGTHIKLQKRNQNNTLKYSKSGVPPAIGHHRLNLTWNAEGKCPTIYSHMLTAPSKRQVTLKAHIIMTYFLNCLYGTILNKAEQLLWNVRLCAPGRPMNHQFVVTNCLYHPYICVPWTFWYILSRCEPSSIY